ncbi:hypothetical protein KIN20_034406 [Parelaphostrongylus tenuis]|uniref:Uncharacterized protein n=1 Tax=Parelaphostrongylus tenuis TaxID=148309 RepID=A0AAD5WIZ6_PARTN|nr:hypothetical protein KIN20_034406 [Parelaphostrongylus tenuis]
MSGGDPPNDASQLFGRVSRFPSVTHVHNSPLQYQLYGGNSQGFCSSEIYAGGFIAFQTCLYLFWLFILLHSF